MPLSEKALFAAYGRLMLRLQLMEMDFWIMRAAGIKKGMSDKQAFDQISKWDRQTFGELVRGLRSQGHWSEDVRWKLDQLLILRNHLAHNFLREFFLAKPSPLNFRKGLASIERWTGLVDELERDLRDTIDGIWGPGWNELSDDEQRVIDALQPERWPLVGSDEE